MEELSPIAPAGLNLQRYDLWFSEQPVADKDRRVAYRLRPGVRKSAAQTPTDTSRPPLGTLQAFWWAPRKKHSAVDRFPEPGRPVWSHPGHHPWRRVHRVDPKPLRSSELRPDLK